MASPTPWTGVSASSRSWWWTGKPGVLQSMGSQRVRHNWVHELNWTDEEGIFLALSIFAHWKGCPSVGLSNAGTPIHGCNGYVHAHKKIQNKTKIKYTFSVTPFTTKLLEKQSPTHCLLTTWPPASDSLAHCTLPPASSTSLELFPESLQQLPDCQTNSQFSRLVVWPCWPTLHSWISFPSVSVTLLVKILPDKVCVC